ncbi:MAG: nucleotidyltransferase family protein [Candidatus Saganbacteria bacterium]|nr:nucleotidyltransferase family protein [Candidatus Saganbacteria bacterium]
MVKKFGVKKIGLFGSYLRGDFNKKSDLDLLVEFRKKTFDNYMGLKFFLEDAFDLKVDLVTKESLKPRLKPLILKEVEYAKGL